MTHALANVVLPTRQLLADKVAEHTGHDDWQTEQGELRFGTHFGIVTDIPTGPDGNLRLVGTSSGTIRKIYRP